MDRRAFLRLLGISAAGAGAHALDIDKLLWVPGQKTIFLPPQKSVTTLVTSDGVYALNPGDIITIDSYYHYYPKTGVYDTHRLQEFVITGAVASNFTLEPYRSTVEGTQPQGVGRKGFRGYQAGKSWKPMGADWRTS